MHFRFQKQPKISKSWVAFGSKWFKIQDVPKSSVIVSQRRWPLGPSWSTLPLLKLTAKEKNQVGKATATQMHAGGCLRCSPLMLCLRSQLGEEEKAASCRWKARRLPTQCAHLHTDSPAAPSLPRVRVRTQTRRGGRPQSYSLRRPKSRSRSWSRSRYASRYPPPLPPPPRNRKASSMTFALWIP